MTYPPRKQNVIKFRPRNQDLLLMRAIAFENLDRLTLFEKVKLRLGLSVIALYVSRHTLNNFYLSFENEKAVGFAIRRFNKLRSLFVLPKFKGRGHGSILLDEVIKDSKFKTIIVKPVKSSREFYLKKGFYPVTKYCYARRESC